MRLMNRTAQSLGGLWSRIWIWLVPSLLLLMVVGIGTLIQGGTLFCRPLQLDLNLPSENAIPKDVPARPIHLDDPVWRFRYAAIGTEFRFGVPYWIYRVMPRIFDEVFRGGGYEVFGIEPDDQQYYLSRPMPRGFLLTDTTLYLPTFEVVGKLKRVVVNCSGCHRGAYVDSEGKRHLVDGMPNGTINLQRWKMFMNDAALDARFTPERVIREINSALAEEKAPPLTRKEELVYTAIVFAMREISQRDAGAWQRSRPLNGPGRIDPFNAVKIEVLNAPDDHTAAALDYPSIWNQRSALRERHHYDGNTANSDARNYGSILGVGGIAMSIPKGSIRDIGSWIDDLPPPRYPFPIDAQKAQRGKGIFQIRCASCHSVYDRDQNALVERGTGYMLPDPTIGTDPERILAFPKAAAEALSNFGERRGLWPSQSFREATGYLRGPLDGIWARAPYLHNGSVPTLEHLLRPTERPSRFCRGRVAYDPRLVGFEWKLDGCDAPLFVYETSQKGNANSGHTYPINDPDERSALIEYLKTL